MRAQNRAHFSGSGAEPNDSEFVCGRDKGNSNNNNNDEPQGTCPSESGAKLTILKTRELRPARNSETPLPTGNLVERRSRSLQTAEQQQQRGNCNAAGAQSSTSPSNYISNLVSKSGLLLGALKHNYASYLTGGGGGGGGESEHRKSVVELAARNNMQSSVTTPTVGAKGQGPRAGSSLLEVTNKTKSCESRGSSSNTPTEHSQSKVQETRERDPQTAKVSEIKSCSISTSNQTKTSSSLAPLTNCTSELLPSNSLLLQRRQQRLEQQQQQQQRLGSQETNGQHEFELRDGKRTFSDSAAKTQTSEQTTNPYGERQDLVQDHSSNRAQQLRPNDVKNRDNQFREDAPKTDSELGSATKSRLDFADTCRGLLGAGSNMASGQNSAVSPNKTKTKTESHEPVASEPVATLTTPKKPPLPPPPPPEIVQAVAARSIDNIWSRQDTPPRGERPTAAGQVHHRRHALQEHSLERDAALSFKVVHTRELKHKRASSIRSALSRAHLGPLRSSSSRKRQAREAAASALAALTGRQSAELSSTSSTTTTMVTSGGGEGKKCKGNSVPRSMPYELFEPPVTQRTVERSRRRGAMASQMSMAASAGGSAGSSGPNSGELNSASGADFARRQLSFDTINLRQLTDEYFENAGLKQPSGMVSMVALNAPTNTKPAPAKPGAIAVPGGSSTVAAVVAATVGSSATSQAQCALEAHLYQVTRRVACLDGGQHSQAASGSVTASPTTNHTTGQRHRHHQSQKLTNSAGSLELRTIWSGRSEQSTTARGQQEDDYGGRLGDGEVTILPGQLPWQSDVSIQCELLQAPTSLEPYETTGDILNTIARPFRGPTLQNYSTHTTSFESSSNHHNHHHHLSATLKRGLSAISQHHLSPGGSLAGSMAMNVVGSLKKSISNTFDVGAKSPSCQLQNGQQQQQQQVAIGNLTSALTLRSDDSLPAYASLQNECDNDDEANDQNGSSSSNAATANGQDAAQQSKWPPASGADHSQQQQLQQSGLIGQLASKLSRQSSRKFTEGKRGLQRALSFDCRGYKRLGQTAAAVSMADGSVRPQDSTAQSSADSACSFSLGSGTGGGGPSSQQLMASRQRVHNKSSLALLQSPRPYLPQSASQVDFQVPLLPYERMQEAIVSQRLLEPPPESAAKSRNSAGFSNNSRNNSNKLGAKQQPDADELICGGGGTRSTFEHEPKQATRLDDDDDFGDQSPETAGRLATISNSELGSEETEATRRHQQQQLDGNLPDEEQFAASEQQLDRQRTSLPNVAARCRREQQLPRLVFNIPTIANEPSLGAQRAQHNTCEAAATLHQDDHGQVTSAIRCDGGPHLSNNHQTVISSLPSPGGALLEPSSSFDGNGAGQLSQSPSFCLLDPRSSAGGRGDETNSSNLLTANDVFKHSKNFIKRPSTMMASDEAEDAMNQVAAALGQATSQKQLEQATSSAGAAGLGQVAAASNGSRRSRRKAIVPPKLATDVGGTSSESESRRDAQVGRLVDLGDADPAPPPLVSWRSRRNRYGRESSSMDEFCAEEEAQLNTIRRKRSGGGIEKLSTGARQQQQPAAHTNSVLPTVQIEDSLSTNQKQQQLGLEPETRIALERPDSQATNADSIVSSESTTSVCMSGRLSPFGNAPSSGAVSPTGPTGSANSGQNSASLTVPFAGNSSSRRRSSIAVIPQMQICPGDLLVYSKQLIDRMNQTDENEPPQFLTIDDKKGKNNIWASFKLCAQFDNRILRARNELLCSLEDVLASLQPSTFVDEQLSHYKGMLWNEFLCETESRRSASSEPVSGPDEDPTPAAANQTSKHSYKDELINEIQVNQVMNNSESKPSEHNRQQEALPAGHRRTGSMRADEIGPAHEGLKCTMSSGCAGGSQPPSSKSSPMRAGGGIGNATAQKSPPGQTPAAAAQPIRTLSSRFREKPKLKRGQTVDSVFRIPLIPSSPLKHAQQHQQTPTAHLEDHELKIIEDDERSSMGSANSGGAPVGNGDDQQQQQQQQQQQLRSASLERRSKRSSSTRSRSSGRPSGEQIELQEANRSGECPPSHSQDSSFDTEDARDLLEGSGVDGANQAARHSRRLPANGRETTTPNQLVRQSSLSTLASTITRTEQKRQRALWDLFQSECTFFFDHLLTLKNVYMEPLKKIQVEGFAMFADPDVLFGNLDELCCGVYDFCKEFLYIIKRTLKTRPEELNATDVLIKLYKKNPKIDHLRAVYHRYTLNYINALTYLDSLRRQVEFVEFEKWSSRDSRCKKLQLTDLLVAPVQHIMRVPIILKDIEAHTENVKDREEIRAILAVEEASLRELDDKMRWLKNFERLLEIQKNIQWPSVFDMELKLYVPEFLKEVLSKQPCEKLIVSPKRQIVHEGTLSNLDLNGKPSDMHVILFDDMLLMTRRKKQLTKKSSTICKSNSGGGAAGGGTGGGAASAGGHHHSASSMLIDDGSFKYVVYKQPLSLDRFYVHDVQQVDSQSIGIKHLFLLIVMNRFQQIINVHSFAAHNDDLKQTWLFKIKKTAERWKRINSSTSSSQQQQQQQQQQRNSQQNDQHHQQSISTSKSMPMSSTSGVAANHSTNHTANRPAAQVQVCVQQPASGSGGQQNPTKQLNQALASHQQASQSCAGTGLRPTVLNTRRHEQQQQQQQQPIQQPIEFVITSASESPASEQQKCR